MEKPPPGKIPSGAPPHTPSRKLKDWELSAHDVHVLGGEENVLGKGAYGEVRRGLWRGLPVAAKRLHMLSGAVPDVPPADLAAVVRAFEQELDMLSVLKHPNLLALLGCVCDDAGLPVWIITELMEGSLYQLLHEHKLDLSLAEVVDIATHVAVGLEYLHAHDPPILHRDISSKNVLLSGAHVRISDLGQAKFFNVADARNTTVPGAIVYSAPEVLTGQYSPSIDVFSFGVLLVQMCTREYPALPSRLAHIDQACTKFPLLADLIRCCLSANPTDRPSAAEIRSTLSSLKDTAEYVEKQHCHSGGVLAERVLQASLASNAQWSAKYASMKATARKYRADAADAKASAQAMMRQLEAEVEALSSSGGAPREAVIVLPSPAGGDAAAAPEGAPSPAERNAHVKTESEARMNKDLMVELTRKLTYLESRLDAKTNELNLAQAIIGSLREDVEELATENRILREGRAVAAGAQVVPNRSRITSMASEVSTEMEAQRPQRKPKKLAPRPRSAKPKKRQPRRRSRDRRPTSAVPVRRDERERKPRPDSRQRSLPRTPQKQVHPHLLQNPLAFGATTAAAPTRVASKSVPASPRRPAGAGLEGDHVDVEDTSALPTSPVDSGAYTAAQRLGTLRSPIDAVTRARATRRVSHRAPASAVPLSPQQLASASEASALLQLWAL